MRRPVVGELVGVKRLGHKGIVVAVRELGVLRSLFPGAEGGIATVLVDGRQEEYSWDAIYAISTADEEETDDLSDVEP